MFILKTLCLFAKLFLFLLLYKGLYCIWSVTNTHPQSILLNTVFVCTRKVRGLTRGACRGKYIVDYFLETILETSAKHFITKTVLKTQVPFNEYKLSWPSSVFIYYESYCNFLNETLDVTT